MALLFHPKVLHLLTKFKKKGSSKLLNHILCLLLDNTCSFEISFVYYILFSHVTFETNGLESLVESIIRKNFMKKNINGIYLCFIKGKIPNSYKDLILLNREDQPSKLGSSENNFIENLKEGRDKSNSNSQNNTRENSLGHRDYVSSPCIQSDNLNKNKENRNKHPTIDQYIFESQNSINCLNSDLGGPDFMSLLTSISNQNKLSLTPKKEKPQQKTLNFTRVSLSKSETIEKFAPLSLKNATFVYSRNNIIYDTQRKRDDLINPVALQFIKFHDNCKPPIYRKRGLLQRVVFSDKRIPGILTYDEESSDWEECTDSVVSEESISEETEEPGDEEWVEKDSEDVEVSRYNKKPCFIFQNVQIETLFDENEYLNANLVLSDEFNDGMVMDFINFKKKFKGSNQEMVDQFSLFYNVTTNGISNILSIINNRLS